MFRTVSRFAAAALLLVSVPSLAEPASPAERTTREIRATLGVVPTFMIKAVPEAGLPSAWEMWKAIELSPKKALGDKYLSLISFAVAAQIPCRYCIIADREFAALAGATEEELNEAAAIAAITRFWSTWLNGNQFDEAQFRKEADQIFAYVRKPPAATPARVEVTDGASALRDVQQTLGIVPTFIKAFPEEALPGAWMQMKSVQLAPATAIPGKYKELIGLAVAAQIPCRYCVIFHTNAAKLNGATDAEIKNALAEASLTRYFSTVINGYGQDEAAFRREIQGAVRAMKKQMSAPATH